jgi:3-hydroxybutyryl-CoA dehydrogenase
MKATVIGSGAMGSGIAQVLATAGWEVQLFDQKSEMVAKALGDIRQFAMKAVEKGKMNADQAEQILGRIQGIDSLQAASGTDLVIEAIIEDLSIKQKLFAELEAIVSNEAILASNTSSLSIASISSVLQNKERFLGIHFFNPAPLMPLVEVIPGFVTSDAVREQVLAYVKEWGKTGVLAKDTPGFIVNRLARPFYGESLRMAEEGIANFETIDYAMKELGGFKMGPFELMDFIGHDVNFRVTETVWQQMFFDARYRPSLIQKRLFESGLYGRKTGRGYYRYEQGLRMAENITMDSQLHEQVFNRVMLMLFNEAIEALHLQIASKEDLDTAMMKGVNYPKGLLAWAESWGYEAILSGLDTLHHEYGDDRYRPSVLLRRWVRQKGN